MICTMEATLVHPRPYSLAFNWTHAARRQILGSVKRISCELYQLFAHFIMEVCACKARASLEGFSVSHCCTGRPVLS